MINLHTWSEEIYQYLIYVTAHNVSSHASRVNEHGRIGTKDTHSIPHLCLVIEAADAKECNTWTGVFRQNVSAAEERFLDTPSCRTHYLCPPTRQHIKH